MASMPNSSTAAALVRRRTARMRALGLVPRQVWAHREDFPEIFRLALPLNAKRLAPKGDPQ